MGSGIMDFQHELHPETVKKLHKSHRAGKGCRIALSHQEIRAEGIGSWLKGAWNTVKNAVNSKTYQSYVRPILHEAVKLVPMDGNTRNIVDQVGSQTKAWGMKGKRGPKKAGSYRTIQGSSYAVL